MSKNLKILVVDDTIFYRKLLSNLIEEIHDVDLMGVAPNGKIAIQKIELSPPDLVFLDVNMPGIDGLEALKLIKSGHPGVDVVMVSGADSQTAGLTVKALEAGALDFVSKPQSESHEDAVQELKTALRPIIALAKTMKYSRDAKRFSEKKTPKAIFLPPSQKRTQPEIRDLPQIDVVALGVSTGGPNALKKLVPMINRDFPVPIVAVQHMPPTFTASLAESLDQLSAIEVVEGKAEQEIKKGVMYIAPGGYHMVVRKTFDSTNRLGILDTPPVFNCRPAADVLFRSMGMAFGKNILTVILTGMGRDGAAGVAAIRRKGGYSIVQDEESSVIWGMPGTVVQAGDADEILPLDRIAQRIMEIVIKSRM